MAGNVLDFLVQNDMTSVTCFSQRDERWEAEILGTGKPTIGKAGCLITSIASMLADFGVPTDPHRLNQWLITNGGYHDDNLFVFDSPAGLGADLQNHIQCERVPAPVDVLMDALGSGCGIVVKVDYEPGEPVNQHWVRLIGLSTGSGWIMDPWQMPGGEMVSLDDYLKAGWKPARGIFAAAIYAANGDRVFRVRTPEGEHQDRIAIRLTIL